jgi:hypothetical protein
MFDSVLQNMTKEGNDLKSLMDIKSSQPNLLDAANSNVAVNFTVVPSTPLQTMPEPTDEQIREFNVISPRFSLIILDLHIN